MSCKHIFTKGKSTGETCKNNAHHDGFCWKHKKNVVPDHIANEVGGKKVAAPKAKSKFKFSVFMFTVNSNTNAAKMSVEQVREFKRLIGFIFEKEKVVEYLVDRSSDDPKTNLVELDTNFFFEVAPTTHALHCHGLVRLKHTGNYSLDIPSIRAIIAGILGKKVHINVRANGDDQLSWEQYCKKNQMADKI